MAQTRATPENEDRLLGAARDGDENAFASLVEPYRPELHAHCYRMLGSVQDAEDTLQEVLLRAWKALDRFEGRSSLRSWLYTIATNTCLNLIARRPKRVLPIDYAPAPLKPAAGVHSVEGDLLRHDAADALTRMVGAAAKAGVGEIGLQSGYRSFATQQRSYAYQVDLRGTAKADLVSARPGYSEHQSGLTGDLVACTAGRCGSLDELARSAQGRWLAAHAWEYGWVVRYEPGRTGETGYLSEPWHLRYLGTELSTAYRAGGFHTLEEFFGLPAAPDYHR